MGLLSTNSPSTRPPIWRAVCYETWEWGEHCDSSIAPGLVTIKVCGHNMCGHNVCSHNVCSHNRCVVVGVGVFMVLVALLVFIAWGKRWSNGYLDNFDCNNGLMIQGPVACLHAVDLLHQGPYHTGIDHHALVRWGRRCRHRSLQT